MSINSNQLKKDKIKKLRYVSVYEKLYNLIQDGEYPKGTQLPSENDLALQMGVSRMTLRQALQFLQDDGIIKNIRGKGNFVINNISESSESLETFSHPIYKCLDVDVDDVEIEFNIEPSSEYCNKILKKDTPVVVCVSRWYKSQGDVVAYTFSTLPVDTVYEYTLDLNNKEYIKTFIDETIYSIAKGSSLKIQYSKAGNISATKYKISDSNEFYLIQEEIYFDSNYPAIHNKHYLPIDISHLDIQTNNF